MHNNLVQYRRNIVTKYSYFEIDFFYFSRLDVDHFEQWQKNKVAKNPDVYQFEGNSDLINPILSKSHTINILYLKKYKKNCIVVFTM